MHCSKEMDAYSASRDFSKSLSNENDGLDLRSTFRMPRAGEPVALCGSRKRPDLNGSRGEVISSGTDEFGRVTVKLWGSNNRGLGGSRSMLVQPSRLQPLLQDGSPAMTEFNQMVGVMSPGSIKLGNRSDLSVISAAESAAVALSSVEGRDSDRMVLAPLGRSESTPSFRNSPPPRTPLAASMSLNAPTGSEDLAAARAEALASLRGRKSPLEAQGPKKKGGKEKLGRSSSASRSLRL